MAVYTARTVAANGDAGAARESADNERIKGSGRCSAAPPAGGQRNDTAESQLFAGSLFVGCCRFTGDEEIGRIPREGGLLAAVSHSSVVVAAVPTRATLTGTAIPRQNDTKVRGLLLEAMKS
jgi:hypothetical protein